MVAALTPACREKTRLIDRVIVKGSTEPLGILSLFHLSLDLYTCDVEFAHLALDPLEPRISRKD